MSDLSPALLIHPNRIIENYAHLRCISGDSECAAVVKANSYGLGARKLVQELLDSNCCTFFVAHAREVGELSPLLEGTESRLFVLNGVTESDLDVFRHKNVRPVLNSIEQVQLWADHGYGTPAALFLETGFGRLGLPQEFDETAAELWHEKRINFELILSHLACADDPSSNAPETQLNQFRARTEIFGDTPASIANSAAIFRSRDFHLDLTRSGIALYGGQPSHRARAPDIKNAFSWKAPIIQIQTIRKGNSIGYGASYIASQDMKVAVIGAGYADGVPIAFSNRASVSLNGEHYPLVGRVSMDSFTVDISDTRTDKLKETTWVDLIGPDLSLEQQARASGVLNYEILTRIGGRTQRVYTNN